MTPREAVREFHEKFKIPRAPFTSVVANILRMNLIREEAKEVEGASKEQDPEHMLKELADLVYVTYGTAETFGWDLDEAVRRVHESNMSKLGSDGEPIYRMDGKVLKGPNYKEPDLKDLV